MTPTPNYDDTIAFLRAFRPVGFWLLTAIRTDKKKIQTIPFAPSQHEEVRAWLEEKGKDHNLYFAVNPTSRMMSKKAEKEDISTMEYLHVDIDQRPGEEFEAEIQRALRITTEALPDGIPEPTFVIHSGGGVHAYWRLEQPFPIDGDPGKCAEAERYNQQMEVEFGGDHCWNIDRIMRLPGTLNRPDQKKIDKGRVTTLAHLVKQTDVSYPLSKFVPVPLVQDGLGFSGGGADLVDIDLGNIKRLDRVDELAEWKVPDHTQRVIVQGVDPDQPHRWGSRSEPLWYVVNELVRHDVPDEVIYSVITDPKFLISESVVEKGRGMDKYAKKQINDAKEVAVSPLLHELNSKHAVVRSVGGHCRVISEEWDEELGRLALDYQTSTDFNTFYMNRTVEVTVQGKDGEPKVISQPLGKWWMTHPKRRSYERVIFAPGRDIPGSYNLWTGFAYEPRPGSCDLYLKHLKDNICSGDEDHFRYLLGWMACAVQRPGEQGHVAIVLKGKRGAGKGVFASTFGSLFGRHFMPVTHGDHLVGKFNAHLRDCVVLFGDEAFFAGDKRHEGMLKVLITEKLLMTEKKGVDPTTGRNYTHVILASNDDWVVPAGENERRFFILHVSDGNLQDTSYFAEIGRQMENGGYEALLHYLMHYDLSDFSVRDVPKTEALQAQKEHSFSSIEEWWYSKLQDGEIFDGQGWPSGIPRANLRENLTAYTKAFGAPLRANATKLGQFIRRVVPDDWELGSGKLAGTHTVIEEDGEPRQVTRPNGYLLPPLEVCREHWEKLFGGKFKWNTPAGTTADTALGLHDEAF